MSSTDQRSCAYRVSCRLGQAFHTLRQQVRCLLLRNVELGDIGRIVLGEPEASALGDSVALDELFRLHLRLPKLASAGNMTGCGE